MGEMKPVNVNTKKTFPLKAECNTQICHSTVLTLMFLSRDTHVDEKGSLTRDNFTKNTTLKCSIVLVFRAIRIMIIFYLFLLSILRQKTKKEIKG